MASCTDAVVQRNVTASTVTAKESMFPVDALATRIAKPAVTDVLTANAQNAAVVQIVPAATPGILSPPGINAGPQKHVDVTGHATRHILTDAHPDISATVITAHRDARVARPTGALPGHLWREQPHERDAMSGQTRRAAIIPGRLNLPGILIIVTKAILSRPGGILV